MADMSGAEEWRMSTRSQGNGACVEVAVVAEAEASDGRGC